MLRSGQTIKPMVKIGRDPAACWKWLGPKTEHGHGKKTYCGKETFGHRWMWELLFGPIPKGWVVFHACESKECCNPNHLRLGKQADANRASINAVLMSVDAYEIANAKENAGPQTANELAAKHGCSTGAIYDIWQGRTWRLKKAPNNGPNGSARKTATTTGAST